MNSFAAKALFSMAVLASGSQAACPDGYKELSLNRGCVRLTEARKQSVAVTLCNNDETLIDGRDMYIFNDAKALFLSPSNGGGPSTGAGGPGKFFWTGDAPPNCMAGWSRSVDYVPADCEQFYPAMCLLTRCPRDYIDRTADGLNCYHMSDSGMSYSNAQTYCQNKGGRVIRINSAAESIAAGQIQDASSANEFWLDARATAGKNFKWADDNSAVASGYTCWNAGEPNNGAPNEPCVHAGFFGDANRSQNDKCDEGKTWNDVYCNRNTNRALCEAAPLF